MRIQFDHEVAADGSITVIHTIETSDPAVQAMLTACKGNPAAQNAAGYSVITKHVGYVGLTRWQAVLGEVIRLNDVTARGFLGV